MCKESADYKNSVMYAEKQHITNILTFEFRKNLNILHNASITKKVPTGNNC